MSPRELFLSAALALALIASTVFGDSEDESMVAQPTYRPLAADRAHQGAGAKPGVLARLELGRLENRTSANEASDLFASKSWYVPPPPPKVDPVAVKPPAPTAPPLPFTYFGRITDSKGEVVIYLHRSGQVYTLKQGEKIEDQYQLESVTETQLGFVYLPLKTRQTLNMPRQ
jgi:hypothetical protein